ncbi:MAG: TauD/TfdA family dioxygenase [Ilumatobacteraceae bacterium]
MEVTPSGQVCGATVTGIDLRVLLTPTRSPSSVRRGLEHHVLAFPGQPLDDDDLERFTQYFGPFGDDPYIGAIPGREHVIAISRRGRRDRAVVRRELAQ